MSRVARAFYAISLLSLAAFIPIVTAQQQISANQLMAMFFLTFSAGGFSFLIGFSWGSGHLRLPRRGEIYRIRGRSVSIENGTGCNIFFLERLRVKTRYCDNRGQVFVLESLHKPVLGYYAGDYIPYFCESTNYSATADPKIIWWTGILWRKFPAQPTGEPEPRIVFNLNDCDTKTHVAKAV